MQSCHAAHEAGIRFGDKSKIHNLIVCSVKNEEELHKEAFKLKIHNIDTFIFKEPDMDNEATAIASELISGCRRKYFSKFKLWSN